MTDPGASPNAFEQDKPGTIARDRAEGRIEGVCDLGGVFVEAVRATRLPMVLTDPTLPGDPIVFANQSFLDLSGYTMEEVLGQQPHFLNGTDTDTEDAERFRDVLSSDHDGVVETVQYAKDGRRFVAVVLLSAFKGDDGRTLHHFLTWTDVTRRVAAEREASELRRSQKALEKSEADLRAFIAASEDVIYRMSPDWSEMRDLRGQNFLVDTTEPSTAWMSTYIRGADHGTVGQAIKRAIDTKGVFELEHQVLRADGTVGWVLSRAVPMLGDDGEIAEWIGAAKDVTARRQSEEALRASEEKYRSLFESIDEGFVEMEMVLDGAGEVVDWRWLEFNPSFERMSGLTAVKGRLFSEVVPDVEPEWAQRYGQVIRTGESLRFELPVAALDSWFDVFVSRIGGEDSRRVAVTFNNITARKRAEEALRESEQRQAFLLQLSDALRAEPSADAAAHRAVRLLADHIDLDRCYLVTFREDEDRADITHQAGTDRTPPIPPSIRISDFPEAFRTFHERRLVVEDMAADQSMSDADRQNMLALGFGALLVPTLRKGASWALVAVSASPRRWTPSEIALVEEVSERAWAAVERAHAEARLRESEARLVAAFETVPVGVAVIDTAGTAVAANVEFRRFLPTGLIPSRDTSRVGRWRAWDEAGEPVSANDFPGARALRGEAVVPGLEMLFTDDDGREIWTRVATVPTLDTTGAVTGVVTTISDIDAAKRSADALGESEERLRLIVENAEDYAIFTTDPSGTITDWREGAEAVFDYSREEILGQSCDILFTPEDRENAQPDKERATAAATGKASDVRWHLRKDGVRVFIDGVSTALRTPEGELIGFLKIGQDITERHAAGERQKLLLAELQHRVRNTLGMIRSMVRFTAEGHDDVEDYLSHLTGRLDSLSRTQQLLTRSSEARVDLHELVSEEMTAQAGGRSAYALNGPKVTLAPKAAEVLSLALHELVTNSVKYGALGDVRGADNQVSVRWDVTQRDGQDWLELRWREPAQGHSSAPRQGFGTELITQRVPYELRGEASLNIGEREVVAEIAFPLADGPSSLLETGAPRTVLP